MAGCSVATLSKVGAPSEDRILKDDSQMLREGEKDKDDATANLPCDILIRLTLLLGFLA